MPSFLMEISSNLSTDKATSSRQHYSLCFELFIQFWIKIASIFEEGRATNNFRQSDSAIEVPS